MKETETQVAQAIEGVQKFYEKLNGSVAFILERNEQKLKEKNGEPCVFGQSEFDSEIREKEVSFRDVKFIKK